MSGKYKSRKNNSTSAIPINYKIVIVVGAFVLVGLAYYLIDAHRQIIIHDTGYKMNMMRQEIQRTRDMNSNLRTRLAEMRKYDVIKAKLIEIGIKLKVPPIEKVYRLKSDSQVGRPEKR